MDKRIYLKVKIKSLAAEARIIRKEEKKKHRASIHNGLLAHRRGIVRTVARHTHLAYGFIRGRAYEQLEKKCTESPSWPKVRAMVEKYGTEPALGEPGQEYMDRRKELLARFDNWVQGSLV